MDIWSDQGWRFFYNMQSHAVGGSCPWPTTWKSPCGCSLANPRAEKHAALIPPSPAAQQLAQHSWSLLVWDAFARSSPSWSKPKIFTNWKISSGTKWVRRDTELAALEEGTREAKVPEPLGYLLLLPWLLLLAPPRAWALLEGAGRGWGAVPRVDRGRKESRWRWGQTWAVGAPQPVQPTVVHVVPAPVSSFSP